MSRRCLEAEKRYRFGGSLRYKALTSDVKCATILSEKLNEKNMRLNFTYTRKFIRRFRVTYDIRKDTAMTVLLLYYLLLLFIVFALRGWSFSIQQCGVVDRWGQETFKCFLVRGSNNVWRLAGGEDEKIGHFFWGRLKNSLWINSKV